MKKSEQRYILDYRKLGNGKHTLDFDLKKEFFEIFDYSEYQNGNVHVNMNIDIENSNIIAHLSFSGYVEVQCDICLENFNQSIESKKDIVFKFTDIVPDIDTTDDLIYISNKEEKIDLKKHFYDYIVLSLPMKKVHPLDKQGKRTCNKDILKKLEELKYTKTTKDPRWDNLKKFFN